MAEGAVVKKKQKVNVPFDYDKYLRKGKLPHIWCPGCGHGIILKSLLRAIDNIGMDKNSICMASGIGCSSRTPGYVDFNTLHSLHGRAIAFATGVKLAKPEMNILITIGDGDALAIGGNHFIHACRRNIDMTVIIYSNAIYGMTGGQVSPTTPEGAMSTTSPHGNMEPAFDACAVAEASGATFVARSTAYHMQELEKVLRAAMEHKGMSVVEVIDSCPVYYGRQNKYKSASQMMEQIEKDGTISGAKAKNLTEEEIGDKFVRGILKHDKTGVEYCDAYDALIEKVQGKK